MNKKLVSLLISSAMILSSLPMALADNSKLVTSVKNEGGKITVEGIGEKNEAVDIFVLNPEYDVDDLNAIDTAADKDAKFNEVVNYADVVYTGSDKLFKHTFQIEDAKDGEEYVLYVKTDDKDYTLTLATVNIYVSQKTGNDTNEGTEAAPVATVQRAVEIATELSNANPINIIIGEGTYNFDKSLTLTAELSGTANAPVTFKAADGEKVTFTGSKTISADAITKVTDEAVLAKVSDAAAKNLYAIDVAAAGIQKAAEFMTRLNKDQVDKEGKVTKVVTGSRAMPMGLYLNGDSQQISQWPNKTADRKMLKPAENYKDTTISLEGVSPQKVGEWKDADNAYLDGTFKEGWYRESAKIDSVDPAAGTITLEKSPKNGVLALTYVDSYGVEQTVEEKDLQKTDTMLLVKNLLEEIDVPGEWYINKEATTVYYYAPKTLTPSDVLEVGALYDPMVHLKDCDYVTFDGIKFSKSYATAILSDKDSQNLTVTNCTIKDIAAKGISSSGAGAKIKNNVIQNIGEEGVSINHSESNKTFESSGIEVSNNVISNVGMNIASSAMCGITIWSGHGIVVKNNTVNNAPSTGIMQQTSRANIVNNNEVYNVCNYALDAGALYKGRSFTSYGFEFKNNYIHDVGPKVNRTGTHIAGIYLDDLISGGIIEGNIIDMDGEWETYGIINCAGVDNTITNNTAVNATHANIGVTTRPNINGLTPEKLAEENQLPDPATGKYHKELYYPSSGIFATFLDVTNWESIAPAASDENTYREDYRKWAVKKIGTKETTTINEVEYAAPQWTDAFSSYDNIFCNDKMTENYNNLINGVYNKSGITVKDNVASENPGSKAADGKFESASIYLPATNYTDEERDANNTKVSNAEDAVANALAEKNIGADKDILAKVEKDFDLVYPANESTVMTDSTFLKWEASDFADKYTVTVYTDEAKTKEFATYENVEENYVEVTGLEEGKTYYWTVTAVSESGLVAETEVACNQSFSFKYASYAFTNAKYNAANGNITIDAVSEAAMEDITFIAAVKVGGVLKSAVVDTKDITANFDGTITVDAKALTSLDETGAELELYIWTKDMKALRGKLPLDIL